VDTTWTVIFAVLGILDSIPQFDHAYCLRYHWHNNHPNHPPDPHTYPCGASRDCCMALYRQPVLDWNNIPRRCRLIITEETLTRKYTNATSHTPSQT
jgi:hypothetical protein